MWTEILVFLINYSLVIFEFYDRNFSYFVALIVIMVSVMASISFYFAGYEHGFKDGFDDAMRKPRSRRGLVDTICDFFKED